MVSQSLKEIKKAKKESLLLRELSQFFLRIVLDEPRLRGLSINRVKLSQNKGLCTIFFYTSQGKKDFEEKLSLLVLYKPSLRKAIAQTVPSRYTPELVFKFDDQFEKKRAIDELIEKLKMEGRL